MKEMKTPKLFQIYVKHLREFLGEFDYLYESNLRLKFTRTNHLDDPSGKTGFIESEYELLVANIHDGKITSKLWIQITQDIGKAESIGFAIWNPWGCEYDELDSYDELKEKLWYYIYQAFLESH